MALMLVGSLLSSLFLSTSAQFNNPPGVDIWCGKAYRASNASFNPGGQFVEPAKSEEPLLSLKVTPRMSLYLEDEQSGSFLVNASLSYYIGSPYDPPSAGPYSDPSAKLSLTFLVDGKKVDVKGSSTAIITIGKPAEIPMDFSNLVAKLEQYNVTILATSDDNQTFSASTLLSKLPLRSDNGTATRIDNLYGGLSVRKADSAEWAAIFPFTYYVQWTLYWNKSVDTLEQFSNLGYNLIHIVPTGDLGDSPFPWDEFQPYLDKAAELGLYFQYDVLWRPNNLTNMIEQVERLKSHPSILLWYIADEPDGKSNPLNSTRIGYEQIRALDMYHPVSEALNCQDFYYAEYASGSEIILSDVYPISTNTSYSTVYDTPCNATYGCCGCDNCHGSFEDISDRLETFAHFDDVLGWQKTHWEVPQAFGNETFWIRYPTAAEEIVMNVLSINSAAKGLVMWDFPTTSEILNVTNRLATIITSDEIGEFLIGQPRFGRLAVNGASRTSAAAWVSEDQILLMIVNLNYGDVNGPVSVTLPDGVEAKSVRECLWGDVVWEVHGSAVTTPSLLGLEASILILSKV